MNISQKTQRTLKQKYKPLQQKQLISKTMHPNFKCLFFQFPCGAKTKENNQVILNEKDNSKQTQFELSQHKKIVSQLTSSQNIIDQSTLLKQQKIIKNQSFQHRFSKDLQVIKIKAQNNLTNISFNDRIERRLNHSCKQKESYNSENHYKEGKVLAKTRFTYINPSNQKIQRNINQKLVNSYLKPKVFFQRNFSKQKVMTPNYNFYHNSVNVTSHSYQNSPKNKINFKCQPSDYLSVKKGYFLPQTRTSHNKSSVDADEMNNSLKLIAKTTQFIPEIQIQKCEIISTRNFQKVMFSTYSENYRDYMEKQLVSSQFAIQKNNDLRQSLRIQIKSNDQKQNQKQISEIKKQLSKIKKQLNQNKKQLSKTKKETSNQNLIQPNYHTDSSKVFSIKQNQLQFKEKIFEDQLNNVGSKERSSEFRQKNIGESIRSSFAVIQYKQREVQSPNNIYLDSLIHSTEVTRCKMNQSSKQKTFQSQLGTIQLSQDIDKINLVASILKLDQQLNSLKKQENSLISQQQSASLTQLSELKKTIQTLQYLKEISKQRQQQLTIIRQLLRVKIIQDSFNKKPQLKLKYLNDEKGWELYIGGDKQIDLSEDTTQTNQENTRPFLEVDCFSPSLQYIS